MIPLRASRYGGQAGFSTIELLMALTVTLLLSGAIAGLARPARVAFDTVPAQLDLEQRGRTAVDVLSHAVRSAGRNVVAADLLGSLSDLLPVISGADPDDAGAFQSMTVIAPVTDAAQGVLMSDQGAPDAAITLAVSPCPNIKDVCGFTPGAAALIADGAGDFDSFTIATTNPGALTLTPNRPLSRAYPAGSVIVEVEQSTFSLAGQADGSASLIRTTAAGAVQPIADFLSSLTFSVQPQQVDIALSVQATTEPLRRVMTDRFFRMSIRLRNAS